jgi:hypothetical protein
MIAFHFISGFGLVIADTVFMIVGGSAYEVDETLHSDVYPLFPAFCLGRGFIVLSTRAAFSELPAKYHPKATPPLYSWSELASPITFLLLETVVSMALTLLLQTLSSYRHLAKTFCGCFWRSGAPSTARKAAAPAAAQTMARTHPLWRSGLRWIGLTMVRLRPRAAKGSWSCATCASSIEGRVESSRARSVLAGAVRRVLRIPWRQRRR